VEAAAGDAGAGEGPEREDEDVAGIEAAAGGAGGEGGLQAQGQVVEGEDLADRFQPLGQLVDRDPDAGEEGEDDDGDWR